MKISVVFLCVFALGVSSLPFNLNHNHLLRRKHGRIREEVVGPVAVPPAQFFTQTVDHFDAQNDMTYQQRFYVNSTFWTDKATGPVFLFIDGEGAASPFDAVVGHHMEMAKTFGALVFAVEHRYYGASVPTPDLSTENLRFLASEQALADLSVFATAMKQKYGLTSNNTWICFGGSYPGALSAWFRLKYPHIVHAAVASSAPVHAEVNFEGYNEVVDTSLGTTLVGGSSECQVAVRSAFTKLSTMLGNNDGRTYLSTLFHTCDSLVGAAVNDTAMFRENVAGIFQGTVQYNDEIPGAVLNISRICSIMTKPGDELVNLGMLYNVSSAGKCMDFSYKTMLQQLMNVTVDKSAAGVGDRQWLYQTCTQFGYYQTCDANTTCPFMSPTAMDLQSNIDLCEDLFGINGAQVQRRVDFINGYYGSDNPQGSRILFVNGHVDPWHYLSVLQPLSSSELAIFIPGTAHCANMMSSRPNDPPALKAAREQIQAQVGQWLKEAAHANALL